MWRDVSTVARRELAGFFASPAAFLFLGAFLAVTLFAFFWGEKFFARNVADVRPLFQWMPLLLVFLVSALTMRAWAEERRAGTLELLLTAPVSPTALVLGKFLGALALVAIALALTLPLPLTVAALGPLDWGPVIGGYVAALALASAYVAIGLWVSSRTDNQIVSLILTALIAGGLYLIGAPALTDFFGYRVGEWLRLLGTGARFNAITRGVLDLRDLYYYLSLAALFLILNRWSLARLRWAGNPPTAEHRRYTLAAALLAANALAANFWLHPLHAVRLDLTAGRLYTLSEATRTYLRQVQEPLLIRGYFSANTHPLLAPLVPQVRDLLQEYAVAGGERVRVEFVDPHQDPQQEEEAAGRFGIRPVPFQVASKYQASVVNSYFDIVVAYGDEYQTLGFRDLIEVKARAEGDFEVTLRNPEYEITRAIRKVLTGFQGGGNPFSALTRPLTLTAHLSAPSRFPAQLVTVRQALEEAIGELRKQAGDRLQVQFLDPDTDPALAKRLADEGLRPLVANLLDPKPFWFHLTLSDGRQSERVPLPAKPEKEEFRRNLEAAVKRFSPGYLKTVAVHAPPAAQLGLLRDALEESARWLDVDLRDGEVPAAADLLLLVAPEGLDRQQRFAVDQFLMRGGTVILAAAPLDVQLSHTITARPVQTGLEDWLAQYGVKIGPGLVLDRRSGALPIPVERPLGGGLTVREIQLAPYPYIVDVRGDGLSRDLPAVAALGQLSVPWVAPVAVDAEKNKARRVTVLLRSSPDAWISDRTDLLPNYRQYRELGFAPGATRATQTLAVMLEGRFESAFKGEQTPPVGAQPGQEPRRADGLAGVTRAIDSSPESARLIVIGSGSLFSDPALRLVSQALGTNYRKPVELALNLIDWSLEDPALLAIRSRGRYVRLLEPLPPGRPALWEYANYGFAAAGLVLIWLIVRQRRAAAARRHQLLLQGA
ncbi:MAG: Gldg family protein [Burkholderiaceae bacterium]|nr:Gldg family protein [Burkholderiaceae bacterium]